MSNESAEPLGSDPIDKSDRWLSRFQKVLPDTSGFESQRYLIKWLFLSALIGVVAGLSAIAFTFAIDFVTHLSLGKLVGYLPPSPVGEGKTGLMSFQHPLILPIVTAIGGLISGLIVFSLAPEAEGHGTDAAIDAIHHKRARIRGRIPPIKLIASAITIGTGGSGGREGPTAQMSAGFGSILADWFRLGVQDRRIAVCVGIGAGIGAIFRAPLGGALMAAEVLYVHDLEVEALIPTLMASIIGYSIYGAYFGYVPIFGNLAQWNFNHPAQLLYYAMLGLVCGLAGLLYKECFYGTTKLFHKIAWPRWIKPALGGLAVGMIGLIIPGALHTGYGWIQISMENKILGLPLWMILVLPFAKIIATSLSIGSGGSGGIFGPGMVVGGMFGASFWRLTHNLFPGMPVHPAPFVIIGMMALFGGIAHAPLAVMLMVAEMTGNLSLLAPAMLAVAISTAVVGDHTIYKSQLRTRADSPSHRLRLSFPLLSSLYVRDAMTAVSGAVVSAETPISMVQTRLATDSPEGVIVINEKNEVIGSLLPIQLQKLRPDQTDGMSVRSLIPKETLILEPDQTLELALDRLTSRDISWAPVAQNRHLIGRLKVRDVMQTYRSTLERSIKRVQNLNPDTLMFEFQIESDSELAGNTLRSAKLPTDTMIVSVNRGGKTVFPNAETRLEPGDRVLIMTSRESEQALRAFLDH